MPGRDVEDVSRAELEGRPVFEHHAPPPRHREAHVVRLAPLTTDDGFRVPGPAPPGIDGLSPHDESTHLDHFLEETRGRPATDVGCANARTLRSTRGSRSPAAPRSAIRSVSVRWGRRRAARRSSGTGSGSPSGTGSASPSGTGSASPSGTGSASPSGTGSGSPSGTGSGSPSGTAPAWASPWGSGSPSGAAPAWASPWG